MEQREQEKKSIRGWKEERGTRFEKRQQKEHVCFLKTHMFLEITQEKGGYGGGETLESDWMRSGC